MKLDREWLEQLIFGTVSARRFTQDSPILPDVWLRYGEQDSTVNEPVDLLFTPHRQASAAELAQALIERVEQERKSERFKTSHDSVRSPRFAYNQTTVVARLYFDELLRVALPLSEWWDEYVAGSGPGGRDPDFAAPATRKKLADRLGQLQVSTEFGGRQEPLEPARKRRSAWEPRSELLWLVRLVGTMLVARSEEHDERADDRYDHFDAIAQSPGELADAFCDLMAEPLERSRAHSGALFLVSLNRQAAPTITRSVLAVKADAARRLFQLSCAQLNWAILDSGVDLTHPAFRKRDAKGELEAKPFRPAKDASARNPAAINATRVIRTYDFTRVRHLLDPEIASDDLIEDLQMRLRAAESPEQRSGLQAELDFWKRIAGDDRELLKKVKALRLGLRGGAPINWSELESLILIPHTPAGYFAPFHDHGTHVAGILAADWRVGDHAKGDERVTDETMTGMCPDINIYDFRVLDENGAGDEYSVMAALQFVRYLNANRDLPLIHGVNLSLAIPHDVANYACGRTPVCDECERVVASGVVVVSAAGNEGYVSYTTSSGRATESYRSISITDPGNAEAVITVGATHRHHPHTYGVSYFSSRGPTGDGRPKPDLVAPGEKILAPVPGGMQVKDGTSMAAPHVSGAAALLMSRHRELVGQPARIKQILCGTSTDLGRERYFQGSGMLDVLRALQHV